MNWSVEAVTHFRTLQGLVEILFGVFNTAWGYEWVGPEVPRKSPAYQTRRAFRFFGPFLVLVGLVHTLA